jgi:tetratricopeptide (TPR) repeat protein
MSLRKAEFDGVETKRPCGSSGLLCAAFFLSTLALACPVRGQEQPQNWQTQVRKYCEAGDWPSAMRLVEAQIARAPQDLDLKAWRARVLSWSGHLVEAEHEYREILAIDRRDPDNWAGLAIVCLRDGKIKDALHAIETAVQIDPTRSDLHATYARALKLAGQPLEARAEFNRALSVGPANAEARAELAKSPQPTKAGRTYQNELRFGVENDSLSYTVANQGQGASITTRWTPLWSTNLGGGFYQRSGIFADKFVGSVTFHAPSFAAVTAGGAIADDNAVIPKSEAFFDLDRGLANHDAKILKGIEFEYGQHWYWYQSARILTLNGTAVLYLPRDWSLTFGATGARSAFSGTGVEWRPSGVTRLSFPLAAWSTAKLSGNIFFAAGAENFASADQIGRFSSQTYGGGLRFDFSSRMYANFTYSYQKRTQNRTDGYSGAGYGIRF